MLAKFSLEIGAGLSAILGPRSRISTVLAAAVAGVVGAVALGAAGVVVLRCGAWSTFACATPARAAAALVGKDFHLTADSYIEVRRKDGWLEASGGARLETRSLVFQAERILAQLDVALLESGGTKDAPFERLIRRFELNGGAEVRAPGLSLVAERAVFIGQDKVLSLLGDRVRADFGTAVLEGLGRVDFWIERGDLVLREGGTLSLDGLSLSGRQWLIALGDETGGRAGVLAFGSPVVARAQIEGDVTFRAVDPVLSIDARQAIYQAAESQVRFCGEVRLTDGDATLTGTCATLDLATGSASMEAAAGRFPGREVENPGADAGGDGP